MKHIPFVIQGNFNKEFLEKMGYRPFIPPPVYTVKNPIMPLEPIKLAYELFKAKDSTVEKNNVK